MYELWMYNPILDSWTRRGIFPLQDQAEARAKIEQQQTRLTDYKFYHQQTKRWIYPEPIGNL